MKNLLLLFSLIAFFALAYLPAKADIHVTKNATEVIFSNSDVGTVTYIEFEIILPENLFFKLFEFPVILSENRLYSPDKIDFGDYSKARFYRYSFSPGFKFTATESSLFANSSGGMPK